MKIVLHTKNDGSSNVPLAEFFPETDAERESMATLVTAAEAREWNVLEIQEPETEGEGYMLRTWCSVCLTENHGSLLGDGE